MGFSDEYPFRPRPFDLTGRSTAVVLMFPQRPVAADPEELGEDGDMLREEHVVGGTAVRPEIGYRAQRD